MSARKLAKKFKPMVLSAAIERLERRCMLTSTNASPIGFPLEGSLGDGNSTPIGYLPSQIRATYGIDKITMNGIAGDGAGQTIAIVVAFDDPGLVSSTASNFSTSDLHVFDHEWGIADPPAFTKVEQIVNGSAPPPNIQWASEAALDVEWAHAIAPQAKILLIETVDASAGNLLDYGVKTAAAAPGVSVVSMSFGFNEFSGEQSYDSDFTTPAGHAGVTFVSSTGDEGAPGNYPAFSPNVLAVGGTNLATTAISSETAYDSSGGGISSYEAKPSYQSSVTQSSNRRTIPDVSFDGDPNTGVAIYDSFNGGFADKWYKIGGTSFSSPAWAGLIAIANQGRAGAHLTALDGKSQTLPAVYSIAASDFHDITSGNNGFPARAGYDLVTGRGSPIANLLVPGLAGVSAILSPPTKYVASISGYLYVDANKNGKLDPGETPLAGVTVFIDTNKDGKLDNGEASTTTDVSGYYYLGVTVAGTFQVREAMPAEYKILAPSSGYYDVVLKGGWNVKNQDWGNLKA